MKHTKTDPACREYRGYREPRNPLTRYLDRRARGKRCNVCIPPRVVRGRWFWQGRPLPADALWCHPRAGIHVGCGHDAAASWRVTNAGTCPSECAASHPGSEHPNPYRSQA